MYVCCTTGHHVYSKSKNLKYIYFNSNCLISCIFKVILVSGHFSHIQWSPSVVYCWGSCHHVYEIWSLGRWVRSFGLFSLLALFKQHGKCTGFYHNSFKWMCMCVCIPVCACCSPFTVFTLFIVFLLISIILGSFSGNGQITWVYSKFHQKFIVCTLYCTQ